jgi:hypothetical protein
MLQEFTLSLKRPALGARPAPSKVLQVEHAKLSPLSS